MNIFQVRRILGGLALLVLLGLTACENGSLTRPQAEPVAQPPPTQQPTVIATATQRVTLPLLTPTVTAVSVPPPSPTTISDVPATAAPPQVITLEPILPQMSYEEVLQQGSVTVGGYTFSLPEGVPGDLGSPEIVGWLPDKSDEIIDVHNNQVVAINIDTGQNRSFSEQSNYPIRPEYVQLLKNDQVVYMTYSPQDQTYVNIWLSGAETNRATNPLLSQKYVSPIVLPNRESMILYDAKNGRTNQTVGNNIIPFQAESKLSANLARLTTSPLLNNGETKRPLHLQLASGINDELIALYNAENFGVVNINTGETKEIIFDEARALIPLNAQWSPDSEKLAILATEKNVPAQFTKLFLFEVEVGQLRELSTGFQYVTNLTWAPDSENLLISVETGSNLNPNGVEYKTSDLFLVNVVSQTIQMVPLLPENTYIDFIWKLSWAPDGQKIVLSAFIPGSNHSLYRIIVKK